MAATHKEVILEQIVSLNPNDQDWIVKELAGPTATIKKITKEQKDEIINKIVDNYIK